MNSNTSSTGGERQDRPGFGWAGRSVALSLWIISVLLWCVLMRQSFTAMPWDDMTVAGERLQELRRPFAAAGMAAHLCGVIASMTTVPVIGVPINSTLDGMDALLAIVQMPPGIPVATVGINGALNAGILAVQMLAVGDEQLQEKLSAYKEDLKKKIVKANEELAKVSFKYKTN